MLFTTVFPNNGVRDAHPKQATQGLSCKQNSCERDQENPEIKQYENLPQKIPCYSGVSKKYFCSKRFRYLGSENVKLFLYYCWVFADFRLKNLAKRIKSGCQKKPGKMLKMSTEGGQQNKFILTSQIGLVEYWTNIINIGSSLLLY